MAPRPRSAHSERVATIRRGFTLTELIASVSVIGALVALLLPAVLATRSAARSHACKNHLRQFGVSLHAFASSDPQRRFCTGAYDYLRDGCPDTYGWVADMVNRNAGVPQKMMCPDSPLPATEKLNDMLGTTTSITPGEEAPPERTAAGRCANWNTFNAGSSQRIRDITLLFEDGYNTNYAASWYLVRSFAKVDRHRQTTHYLKGLHGTVGPLTMTRLASSEINSSILPFLGCAAPGDSHESAASHPIPGFVDKEARLAESFTDGPAAWDGSTIRYMPPGTSIPDAAPASMPSPDSPGVQGADGLLWMHDTRDWYAWHGTQKNRHCNLLMADGSVRSVADVNGDGYLNPGFPVTTPGLGYTTAEVELNVGEVFSGAFVDKQFAPKSADY